MKKVIKDSLDFTSIYNELSSLGDGETLEFSAKMPTANGKGASVEVQVSRSGDEFDAQIQYPSGNIIPQVWGIDTLRDDLQLFDSSSAYKSKGATSKVSDSEDLSGNYTFKSSEGFLKCEITRDAVEDDKYYVTAEMYDDFTIYARSFPELQEKVYQMLNNDAAVGPEPTPLEYIKKADSKLSMIDRLVRIKIN